VAIRDLDGVDDQIVLTGALGNVNDATHGVTLMWLVKLPSTTALQAPGIVAHAGTGVTDGLCSVYRSASTAAFWGTDDPGADVSAAVTTAAGWGIWYVTKAAGSATPRIGWRAIGSGSWSRANGGSAVGSATTPAAGRLHVGSFLDGSGRVNFRYGVCAVWNRDITDAEADGVFSGLSTVAINALAPVEIVEFNQASVATPVAGLNGVLTQNSIFQTTVVTGDDPPGWTFGLGVSGSSAASGPGRLGMFTPQMRSDAWF
jgi:hypothetical protein